MDFIYIYIYVCVCVSELWWMHTLELHVEGCLKN